MDTVEFRIVITPHRYKAGVEIDINGASMIDLVRAIEAPFAHAEGHPKIAGQYSGLSASSHLPPSRHFWGEFESGVSRDKVQLFGCGDCGEIACWPLLARITLTPTQVIWSDFEQPHRNDPEETAVWRYDEFGPFVFDRVEYEAALSRTSVEYAKRG